MLLSSPAHEAVFRRYAATRTGAPRVRILPEPDALGTAGAVSSAVRTAGLDEPFLVLNGDTATDVDFTALVDLHRTRRAAATLALTSVDDARPFGLVTCEADGTVRAFSEKPDAPAAGDISAGTYVLDPATVRDAAGGRGVDRAGTSFRADRRGRNRRRKEVDGLLDGRRHARSATSTRWATRYGAEGHAGRRRRRCTHPPTSPRTPCSSGRSSPATESTSGHGHESPVRC